MAKTRINEAKLLTLMEHLEEGGDTEKASLAACLGGTNRMQNSTIEAYLAAAAERDENFEDIQVGGSTLWYDADDEDEDEDEDVESEDEDQEEEDDQEEEPEPEPQPKPKAKKKPAKKKDYRFFFETEDGLSIELERIESKSDKIVKFREKKAQQIVKVMIKQQIVEVDLVPLRLEDPKAMSEHGVSNEKLLALAVAAQ